MNTEPFANRCPKCQAPLPASAPLGLCAKCLLAAVSTPTEAGQPADRQPPPPIPTVAAAFPQLEILELIGHGGMGVVYKARQPRLDRVVALKLLPQSLAADAAFAERFNREARVLARLNHPNIVTVHDFGQSGGFFYLLMEFVDGVNLRQAMQAGRFTPQQAMMLVPKICEALQFAHDEGILHRDIKPENILLDTKGRVKIADFGIAKLVGEAREKGTLTGSGLAVGTPHYMAPEQLEHPQDVDQRADIYSLGVVFYEMLTGELPIGRFAPPSQKSSVDARVDDVVFHALEKEREKRFRTAGEVKTSVEAITSNPSVTQAVPLLPSQGSAFPERRIPCYISTPEHLSSIVGQFIYIYTGKGELRLDAENLTFVSNWQSTIIPLRDIRELGIGHYSRLAKPIRLDYLAVTFELSGQRRTLFFTPMIRGGISLPAEVNPRVADCWQAVREAVIARTGKAPGGPVPPASSGSYPFSPIGQAIKVGLFAVAVVVAIELVKVRLRIGPPPGTGATMSGPIILLYVCFGLGVLIVLSVRVVRAYRSSRGFSPGEHSLSLRTGFSPSGAMPANPAASPPQPSAGASTPPISETRATCYFNTPKRMRDCFPSPAARVFTCKGELQLDDQNLTFTNSWRTAITIPLKDIEDLSVGQFQMWATPWVMKYARINFLAITFRQQGQSQTVFLTPVEPGAATASDINEGVGRWFERVCQGVNRAAGALPHRTEPASLAISAGPAWNRKALSLHIGLLLIWLPALLTSGNLATPIWVAILVLSGVLAMTLGWFVIGFLQANRALKHGDLDAVTSDDPPAPEPATASAEGGVHHRQAARWAKTSFLTIALFALAVVLLLTRLSYKNRYLPPSGAETVGDSNPAFEGRFVLYTVPSRGTKAPGEQRWNFKCLVPAHHLERLLFIFWTNGVPEVLNDVSAYYKVGNDSIDQDFYVSCDRFTAADSPKGTNGVQWRVGPFAHVSGDAWFPGAPDYRYLETPAHMTVRSGHQGILRFVDSVALEGETTQGRCGVELRIFIEPITYTPVRTDPFEVEGPNYVVGRGPAWTTDEALKAIKQRPIDQ